MLRLRLTWETLFVVLLLFILGSATAYLVAMHVDNADDAYIDGNGTAIVFSSAINESGDSEVVIDPLHNASKNMSVIERQLIVSTMFFFMFIVRSTASILAPFYFYIKISYGVSVLRYVASILTVIPVASALYAYYRRF